jgi:hypothetical protein
MTATIEERRVRFRATAPGLAPNGWGVYDYLADCYAVEPRLTRADAEARAAELENARRGGGFR